MRIPIRPPHRDRACLCPRSFTLLLALSLLLGGCAATSSKTAPRRVVNNEELDFLLERVATEALGEREGAILVIDPQTGRLRAVVNPRLAFEQAFPPGSAIKPFTALAALRAGIVERETRRACNGRYERDDFAIVCSHPRTRAPLDLRQALGYSCNDYFAHVGERLNESAFDSTLAAFGFGARTGVNAGGESPGKLPSGEWKTRIALGESEELLVTPVQMLAAYAAVANGGRLYRPQRAEERTFEPHVSSTLRITSEHRAAVVEGMRAAVSYGTASEAGLDSLPLYVFGKTGTSTSSNGFRSQGWFVAFAADRKGNGLVPPGAVRLGVLVLLKRAHGSEGARIARQVFEAFAGTSTIPPAASDGSKIKVHLVGEQRTLTLDVDEYVTGVVTAEGSVEDEREALNALAIVSRTFAVKNRGRHAQEGYDFCSTTHCQRFVSGAYREAASRAVHETADEILEDGRGQPIDAYFHAACGGATADIATLWGVSRVPYLEGVRDDYCTATADHRWVDRIPSGRLLSALRSDPRTDVGRKLDDVVVIRRDASGRAQGIALEGEQRRMVSGWDLKIVVGRSLGWNVLKSSLFEVARDGGDFVFRGKGFGHGLGLCQEGAHIAARRGARASQILGHYFPGVSISTRRRGGAEAQRSEHFLLRVPPKTDRRDVDHVLSTLESARVDLLNRLRAAGLALSESRPLEVVIHATTVKFIAETGQPGWSAAATSGSRIVLQPVALLRRRGILETTLRHEYAHAAIDEIGRGHAPRWLAEGLAVHFAGEGRMFGGADVKSQISVEELETRLARRSSATEMHALYGVAYRKVNERIRADGEGALWRRLVDGARATSK